ncbi:MAG: sodium:alanine symporter family protein [Spirochaetota bacterium]|nr:sodium:alanine symporter family protein [Spirochaetota bacterium]
MVVFLKQLSDIVWGIPLIVLLLGTGIYLTFLLRGLQFKTLLSSLYLALIRRKEEGGKKGDISHFQALMTALAATVGTGNIAGVATAIATGGPGALFWMWITGFFGMATKYSEGVLAVRYREVDKFGTMCGGPMYYISRGLGSKSLARLFSIFACIAAFGIGNMVQANSVADALNSTFGIAQWQIGIVLFIFTSIVIMGGIKSIARATSIIVPIMIVFYMVGCFSILILYYKEIPNAFSLVFYHAFSPIAASGGFIGAAVRHTIRMGVARGIFSNESGLGSSPIAAAAAKTDEPVRQALVSMTQTFIDTIVVCTLTGLVLIVTGVWDCGKNAAALTEFAFETGLPGDWGGAVVSIGILFFAYSTILGWSYYGEKSIEYLLGERSIKPYRMLWVISVFIGAVLKIDLIWTFSDIMNGLMALPNLIALIALSGIVKMETVRYFSSLGKD